MKGSVYDANYVGLGGVEQYVQVTGNSYDLPLLLYLHGGPGIPATPLLDYYQSDLATNFLLVSWDQRGSGLTAETTPSGAEMTLDRHVRDAHELTLYLKAKYQKSKILLVGHSWGSILGLELASQYPEDYYAYIGVGQIVNMARGETLAREELLRRARESNDEKALATINSLNYSETDGWEDGIQGFMGHRQLLYAYQMQDFNPNAMIEAIIQTQKYSRDMREWMMAAMLPMNALFEDFMSVNFSNNLDYEIPIYFFAGKHDFNTPSSLAEQYIGQLAAPKKQLFWFENSGHSPPWEEPALFNRRMVKIVEMLGMDGT